MRLLTPAIAVALLSSSAGAQIIRAPQQPRERTAWTSLSFGFMQLDDVVDGTTGSQWLFGSTVQYRATIEKTVQRGSTIGMSGSFARVPLTYVPLTGVAPVECDPSCDADATVTQLFATFHAGAGGIIGFHQVIDLGVGATGYSSFRARNAGTKLPPTTLDADLTISIGYGFGYSLSPDMQVDLVQEYVLSMHQRTGLAGGEGTLGRHYTTRLGVRFGL